MKAGTTLDRYVIQELLGEGGVGAVYRARHLTLGTAHAIKIVPAHTTVQRQRVLREARIQARLLHPHVVRVTDILALDGQIALVAELVEGPSLADLIARERLPLPMALDLFSQVLEGVAAAHDLGIVHRDLKPHNVLIALEEGRRIARVSDFGIARARDGELDGGLSTRSGVAMGTPAYMAPEQHQDAGGVDHRADIYSLGCVLYELCVGGRPFCATSIVQLAQACAAEDYPRPRALEPSLPPDLEQVIVDCLRADPEQRPASCAEVRRRIQALGLASPGLPAGLPAPAPRASTVGQTLEPVTGATTRSRAPGVLAGVAALGLLTVAGARLTWTGGEEERLAAGMVAAVSGAQVAPPAGLDPVVDARSEVAPVAPAVALVAEVDPQVTATGARAEVGTAADPARAPRVEPTIEEPAAPRLAASAPDAPAGESGTRWRLEGRGVSVRLVGDAGEFGPGPVPPGRFLVRAAFGDRPEVDAGTVSIRAGEESVIACDEAFQQCRRRP